MMDKFYIAGFVLVLSLLLFFIIYLSIKLCCDPRQPNFEQTETANFANGKFKITLFANTVINNDEKQRLFKIEPIIFF
jgi:hypothetical protein